jgi:hypothetical protein
VATLIRTQTQRPVAAFAQRPQVGEGGAECGQDVLDVVRQAGAGIGQPHRRRATRPLDEPRIDDRLDLRDALAHRRLRESEPGGGPAERALPFDRHQRRQMTRLHPQPACDLCR